MPAPPPPPHLHNLHNSLFNNDNYCGCVCVLRWIFFHFWKFIFYATRYISSNFLLSLLKLKWKTHYFQIIPYVARFFYSFLDSFRIALSVILYRLLKYSRYILEKKIENARRPSSKPVSGMALQCRDYRARWISRSAKHNSVLHTVPDKKNTYRFILTIPRAGSFVMPGAFLEKPWKWARKDRI